MEKLDGLVIANVKDRLLRPERLSGVLEALIGRQGVEDIAVQNRRHVLEVELVQKDEKLTRLYTVIEDGIVELDRQLKDRIQALKTERKIVQASLDRIATQAHASAMITPARFEAFARVMHEKLDRGDVQARKAYLRSVLSYVEVDDDRIRIVGEKATLAAVIAGQQTQTQNARGFVRKWRARQNKTASTYVIEIVV